MIPAQVHADKTASTMKRGAFKIYLVHAVLLNFNTKFRVNFIRNAHTLVGFLPVKYEEDYSTVQRISRQECKENGTIQVTPEIGAF